MLLSSSQSRPPHSAPLLASGPVAWPARSASASALREFDGESSSSAHGHGSSPQTITRASSSAHGHSTTGSGGSHSTTGSSGGSGSGSLLFDPTASDEPTPTTLEGFHRQRVASKGHGTVIVLPTRTRSRTPQPAPPLPSPPPPPPVPTIITRESLLHGQTNKDDDDAERRDRLDSLAPPTLELSPQQIRRISSVLDDIELALITRRPVSSTPSHPNNPNPNPNSNTSLNLGPVRRVSSLADEDCEEIDPVMSRLQRGLSPALPTIKPSLASVRTASAVGQAIRERDPRDMPSSTSACDANGTAPAPSFSPRSASLALSPLSPFAPRFPPPPLPSLPPPVTHHAPLATQDDAKHDNDDSEEEDQEEDEDDEQQQQHEDIHPERSASLTSWMTDDHDDDPLPATIPFHSASTSNTTSTGLSSAVFSPVLNASSSSLASGGSSYRSEEHELDDTVVVEDQDKANQRRLKEVTRKGSRHREPFEFDHQDDDEQMGRGHHRQDSDTLPTSVGGLGIDDVAFIQDTLVRSASLRAAASRARHDANSPRGPTPLSMDRIVDSRAARSTTPASMDRHLGATTPLSMDRLVEQGGVDANDDAGPTDEMEELHSRQDKQDRRVGIAASFGTPPMPDTFAAPPSGWHSPHGALRLFFIVHHM